MPHREHDAYDQELFVMADKETNCYETICEQLLTKEGVADYYDKEGKHQMVFLAKILEDYAEEIEQGMNTKDVIEAEAKRIAESIF